MTDIQLYRESVERLMQLGSTTFISNGQPQHAAVLFETFFKHAKRSVKVFCRNLNQAVFDVPEVIESAADAVKRGVSLDIIVQEEAPQTSKFLKRLTDLDTKEGMRVEIIQRASEKSDSIKSRRENFAVMDEKALRLEPDSSEIEAVASMNNPEYAAKLWTVFSHMRVSLIS